MRASQPSRRQSDLAEMVEMLLDKGVVINADIVVSVGDTELLGVHINAALASFETAAQYGLEFPAGTDMDRVKAAANVDELPAGDDAESEAEEDADETDGEDEADEESDENAGEKQVAEQTEGDG